MTHVCVLMAVEAPHRQLVTLDSRYAYGYIISKVYGFLGLDC